jgi:hypothetical protein
MLGATSGIALGCACSAGAVAYSICCCCCCCFSAGELINVLREAKQKVPESLLAFGTTVKVSGADSKVVQCYSVLKRLLVPKPWFAVEPVVLTAFVGDTLYVSHYAKETPC